MNELIQRLIIICPLVFLAGFVDAVAGGGGLISLPAYMLAGLPTHQAAGCNKFSACLGSITATINYIKSGKVRLRIALYAAIGSLIGSSIGSTFALILSEEALKLMMMVAIPAVSIFIVTKKDIGMQNQEKDWSHLVQSLVSFIIGIVIGCYDGLIGPGTGTFLMIAFSSFLGVELVTASGCAKVANLASNFMSVIIYIMGGKVLFLLAVPAAMSSIIGSYLGAKFAIKGGAKKVRYIMFVVIGLLLLKMVTDYIH